MMKSAAILLLVSDSAGELTRAIGSLSKEKLRLPNSPLQLSVDEGSDPGDQNSLPNRELREHLAYDNPSRSFSLTPGQRQEFSYTAATPVPVSTEWDDIASTTLRGSRELSEDVPPKVVASKIEYEAEGKIFGGSAATSGEYPAFALFCYNGATTCGGCGGALVASQYVLTAASCIVDSGGNSLGITGVRIGASQSQSDGTYVAVTAFTNHPNYVFDTSGSLILRNDISVLTLGSAVSGVTPLSYNRDSNYPSTDGTSVTAIGYGRFSASTSWSTYLRKTILSFQTDASCSTTVASADEVICTTGTNTHACSGDGGVPLLDSNNLILGMKSSFRTGSGDCGTSAKIYNWWAEAATYATWIDEQIGVSTPSAAPTTPATLAPILVATPVPTCSCFSESTTVQVIDKKVPVEMKELKVGQQIFAGADKNSGKANYETVYGFAHHDEDQHTEYLHITTSSSSSNEKASTNSTLEITSNHLIFLQDQKDPVPAGSLQVGDVLIHQSINQKEAEPATITGIKVIRQRGLYAPLTKDGTVIVDGFYVSSYVSIHESAPRVIAATTKLMSEQSFFHWWMAPYRVFCTRVAPQMCMNDYNEEEGYINWLVLGKGLAEIAQGSSNLVVVVGLAIVLFFCGVFMLLESLTENPILCFVLIACGGFFWWRRLSSLTENQKVA